MASPDDSNVSIFDSLRQQEADPQLQDERAKAAEQREKARYEHARRKMAELIGNNSTLPVTISSINLVGGSHTRHSFLDRIFKPLLSANRDQPYTLKELLQETGAAADKLRRFDIFHNDLSMYIDKPDPTNPSTTSTDIDIYLKARERSRISLKTGTDIGNVEGSAYGNVLFRNIFGGAESLTLNASKGTRTRAAYQATFDTPLLSDPDRRLSIDILGSSTSKFWASHEEVLRGGNLKYTWTTTAGGRSGGTSHQIGYTGLWRQITGLAENASPSVRNDAGDSVKSSVSHTWISDQRDNPLLPQRGYFLKTVSEIAGWGPLSGDVAFWKSEMESSAAIPIPIPGMKGDSGVSLNGGLRAGMLYPLSFGFGRGGDGQKVQQSRINDRFQLGGPTDVRGFKMSGLGPRDGHDAVGGDIFAAGSVNLLVPVTRAGKESPLRFQIFANAGRLLAIKGSEPESDSRQTKRQGSRGEKASSRGAEGDDTQRRVYSTVQELGNGLPSLAAGVGLVYAHPVARFELNFSLPLVLRQREQGRKGLQFGVGINFL